MKRTYIVAEIAQGFEGSPELCRRFIKLAKDCGADAIKFQIFNARELCTEDYKYYSLFKKHEIQPEVWQDLIKYAAEVGIDFFSDVYNTTTLEWITKTTIKGIKIHSTDIRNYDLLKELKDKGYLILLGTGGSAMEEIEKAVERLGKNNVILMTGFQSEPNVLEDIELDKINLLKNKFGKEIGIADHLDPNSKLAVTLPLLAVLKGATYVEKHLTIERDYLQLEDYISALNPDEFKTMVGMIRDMEKFNYNDKSYELSPREIEYRKITKRAVLAKHNIAKGKVIEHADLSMLRTGKEVKEILDLEYIIGKTALKDFTPEEVITKESIK